MAGWPGSADENDDDGADGNARGNAKNVGASDWRGSTPFSILTPLLLSSSTPMPTRAPLLFQGPTPTDRSDYPRPSTSLTPPVYASPISSPPVLVSDPSKSGATATVAAVINNPDIELKEAEDNVGGGVNFIVYSGAVFGRLLLVGGGAL